MGLMGIACDCWFAWTCLGWLKEKSPRRGCVLCGWCVLCKKVRPCVGEMGDFGSFVARWGDKCFMLRWGVWSWGGKCFIAPLGVSCWGVVSIKPVMVLGLVREKVRPARLVAGDSGIKFSLHG